LSLQAIQKPGLAAMPRAACGVKIRRHLSGDQGRSGWSLPLARPDWLHTRSLQSRKYKSNVTIRPVKPWIEQAEGMSECVAT